MWLYDWSEEGLEIQCIGDDILGKLVPPHVNIFYCFGGVVSLLLLFQIISGLGLTMYYSPSVVSAFSSVLNIVGQVHLGWLNRSIHRWSYGIVLYEIFTIGKLFVILPPYLFGF